MSSIRFGRRAFTFCACVCQWCTVSCSSLRLYICTVCTAYWDSNVTMVVNFSSAYTYFIRNALFTEALQISYTKFGWAMWIVITMPCGRYKPKRIFSVIKWNNRWKLAWWWEFFYPFLFRCFFFLFCISFFSVLFSHRNNLPLSFVRNIMVLVQCTFHGMIEIILGFSCNSNQINGLLNSVLRWTVRAYKVKWHVLVVFEN